MKKFKALFRALFVLAGLFALGSILMSSDRAAAIYSKVWTDITLTGDGTEASPLKVDTTKMATKTDIVGTAGGGAPDKTISPSQITSDQDNYSPTSVGSANYIRISGDNGFRAITGIADSVAGVNEKTILNVGSFPIYLPMNHPDSDAAHRFIGNNGDYILHHGQSVRIVYDLTDTKWRILGTATIQPESKGPFYSWSAGSGTAGDYGDIILGAIGSGTNTPTASTTTVPGHWLFGTSTNAAWGAFIYAAKTVVTYSAFASAHQYAETIISIPTLSDGSQTFTVELQITESPSSSSLEPNNTVGIRYSHGINGGEWELFNQDNAAAESVADLGIAVVADDLYRLRVEVDKSKTEARAYINGVFVGRVTGNQPNSVVCGARVILLKSAGTTARNLRIHTFSAGAIYPNL